MVSGTFFNELCKNAEYTVQIIEKQPGNGKTSRGATDLDEAVHSRKREREWMIKLRTVYPHGLNKKVDKNVKMIKT